MFLAGLFDSILDRTIRSRLPKRFLKSQSTFQQTIHEILASKGEVSSRRHAEKLLAMIDSFDKKQLKAFFDHLSENLEIDTIALSKAAAGFAEDVSSDNLLKVRNASDSRRLELFRRLASSNQGIIRLVKLREKLISLMKEIPNNRKIDTDLRYLFKEWFNKGFLVLKPINWTTPANILEKIIEYEAVHEIKSWKELRERLDPADRRCFAFFHPVMEDEPLIFVEVALMRDVPTRICDVLEEIRDEINPEKTNTAVFYSISNCQRGLQGISFGNFLIKSVVQSLQIEFSNIKQFVTLSPVPGFRKWARKRTNELASNIDLNSDLQTDRDLEMLLRDYFFNSERSDKQPNDPVARFHLGNGASLHQINLNGDASKKGINDSWGIMVNYKYTLKDLEKNHESYQNKNQLNYSNILKKWASS